MVEIDLKIDGESAFECELYSAPQIGEYLDIQHEYANGLFKVVKVTHRIVEARNKRERIIHYLKVDAITIEE